MPIGSRWVVRTSVAMATAMAIALATTYTALSAPEPRADSEAALVALAAVGKQLGVSPETLSVAAVATAYYPNLDLTVESFKIADSKGLLHPIAVDPKLRPADPESLAAAERAKRRDRFGALDPALAERIEQGVKEPIAVTIWVRDTSKRRWDRPEARGESLSPEAIDELYAKVADARVAALKSVVAPVVERVRAFDSEASASELAPVIGATLSSEVLQELARDPDIDAIYLSVPSAPELDVAKATTGIPAVHAAGTLGRGVRVVDVEAFADRVEANSLYLRPVVQDVLNLCSSFVGAHPTGVAGILLERRLNWFGKPSGEEGMAPAVELRSGGACTSDDVPMQNTTTRGIRWGARIVTLSWGHDVGRRPVSLDKFYDEVVLNQWRTVTKSAGNKTPGSSCTDTPLTSVITSPGLAYNVITVGGFDDHNTADWKDDSMYECSSTLNPISLHNDREKPELVAPATNITVVAPGPANFQTVSGTSVAAPMVAATAALLIEKNGRLSVWPEIIRATVMATADHNIEGATRLSDLDGAGGLNAAAAADLIGNTQRWNGVRYSCSGTDPLTLGTLTVGAGTRQRVVLSWDSDPAYSDYSSRPSADIDLRIRDANGTIVAASLSWDGTNEIVEFDSPGGGTYTLQALRFRCDLPTWLGWAWHTFPKP